MLEAEFFAVFLEPLNQNGFEYMVTGSAASIIYGQPRMTHDIDLVLALDVQDAKKLTLIYPESDFYCPPVEVIRQETARETRGHFNIIHHKSGFKADIYPVGNDKMHCWAMSNRKKIMLDSLEVWLSPIEYVIIRKLEYYREGGSGKHLKDIKGMLESSEDQIDKPFLDAKLKEFGLERQWCEVSSCQ
jgi:hypothetical protein